MAPLCEMLRQLCAARVARCLSAWLPTSGLPHPHSPPAAVGCVAWTLPESPRLRIPALHAAAAAGGAARGPHLPALHDGATGASLPASGRLPAVPAPPGTGAPVCPEDHAPAALHVGCEPWGLTLTSEWSCLQFAAWLASAATPRWRACSLPRAFVQRVFTLSAT